MSTKIIGAEMDGEQQALADASQRGKEEATERLLSPLRNFTIFLYVGTMVTSLAARAAPPDAVASASARRSLFTAGYDGISVTIAFFAAATLLLQAHFARVLKPSPRPRLTPLHAWIFTIMTWMCVTTFFVNCLAFSDEGVGGYVETAAAAVASVANLLMSARTVMRHLA